MTEIIFKEDIEDFIRGKSIEHVEYKKTFLFNFIMMSKSYPLLYVVHGTDYIKSLGFNIQTKYISPYSPSSSRFYYCDIFLNSIGAETEEVTVISFLSIGFLESLLYKKMKGKKITINIINLTHGGNIPTSLYKDVEKIYPGVKHNFKITENITDFMYDSDIVEIIKQSKHIVYESMFRTGCRKECAIPYTNIFVLFSFIVVCLKNMKVGANLSFNINTMVSENAMTQILQMVDQYFEKSTIFLPLMGFPFPYVKFEKFKGPVKPFENLDKIIIEWLKVDPSKGLKLAFTENIQKIKNPEYSRDPEPVSLYHPHNFFPLSYFEKNRHDFFVSEMIKIKEYYKSIENSLVECSAVDINTLTTEIVQRYYDTACNNSLYRTIELCNKMNYEIKHEFLKTQKNYADYIKTSNLTFPLFYSYDIINYNFKIVDLKYDNECKFEIEDFQRMKGSLNMYKLSIDTRNVMEKGMKWGDVTNIINIPKYTVKYIRQRFHPPHLKDSKFNFSRAFIKIFELLAQMNLIDITKKKVDTLHICELPGNFINATNYYIKLKNPNMEFNWYGNSLNPNAPSNYKKYGEVFKDELGYIKKYPNRWKWGPEENDTGDITDPRIVKYFEDTLGESIDFISSDCGLGSCEQADFFDQEKRLSILNFAQCFISLLVLRQGGNAALKIFLPMAESCTISFIYLMTTFFKDVRLVKQVSGSPGSSEIYLICIDKNKKIDSIKDKLYYVLKNYDPDKSLFPLDSISDNFIAQMKNIADELVDKQIKTINRSIYYFDNQDVLKEHSGLIETAKLHHAMNWVKINGFRGIPANMIL